MDLLSKLLIEEAEKGATSINLSDRNLNFIPSQVFLLKNLMRIGLSNNTLELIPKEFASLTNLKYINLKGNLLSEIPNCLCTLPHLDILDISRNRISKLPDRPGFLLNIRILNLSRNRLTLLPLWMGNMKNLELLQIHKNPIEWPPTEIVDCPPDGMEEWLVGLKSYLKNYSQLKNPKSHSSGQEVQDEDQVKNLINILQESLNIQWHSSSKVSLNVFCACNCFLSVLDTFFRTFLVQSRLETGLQNQDDFKKLQNSTMFLAYCVLGLNPIDLAKNGLKEAIQDLNNFIKSYSVQKARTARFQMFGYFCMSSDLEKGLLDLLNPELRNNTKRSHTSDILSSGKSLLFSLSELEEHSEVITKVLNGLDCTRI